MFSIVVLNELKSRLHGEGGDWIGDLDWQHIGVIVPGKDVTAAQAAAASRHFKVILIPDMEDAAAWGVCDLRYPGSTIWNKPL